MAQKFLSLLDDRPGLYEHLLNHTWKLRTDHRRLSLGLDDPDPADISDLGLGIPIATGNRCRRWQGLDQYRFLAGRVFSDQANGLE